MSASGQSWKQEASVPCVRKNPLAEITQGESTEATRLKS